jgi:hypothetical protein
MFQQILILIMTGFKLVRFARRVIAAGRVFPTLLFVSKEWANKLLFL